MDADTESSSREVWNDRRKRLAIKKFGGIRDEYLQPEHGPIAGSVYGAQVRQGYFY